MIAALYIDPKGPYPKIPDVDCWDLKRNANFYLGPWSVVAHPPCGPWSHLKQLSHDAGAELRCGPIAVLNAQQFGGVLEHPAHSGLWAAECLPYPDEPPDLFSGYTIEVCQCEWGHVARKRTWLYCVGVPREALEEPPFPGRQPTHWASGSRNAPRGPVPEGIKVCSAEQRRRTPQLFAEYLVRLARSVRR